VTYKVNAETNHIANLSSGLDLWIIKDLCRSANMETERMN